MLFINVIKYFLSKINLRALAFMLLRQLVACSSPGRMFVIRSHSLWNLRLKHQSLWGSLREVRLSRIITNKTMHIFHSFICLWTSTLKQLTTFTTLHSNSNLLVSCSISYGLTRSPIFLVITCKTPNFMEESIVLEFAFIYCTAFIWNFSNPKKHTPRNIHQQTYTKKHTPRS